MFDLEAILKTVMTFLIGTLIAGIILSLLYFLSSLSKCNEKENILEYRFKDSKVTCFVVTKNGKQLLDCVKD